LNELRLYNLFYDNVAAGTRLISATLSCHNEYTGTNKTDPGPQNCPQRQK